MTAKTTTAAHDQAIIKPRRFVRMFKPRFAPLVLSGKKLQTVRPTPLRMPRPGDILDTRQWSGKPYRSPQIRLLEATITRVDRVDIGGSEYLPICVFPTQWLNFWPNLDDFAIADGFEDWPDMLQWFEENHDLPFTGIIIYWE